MPAVLRALLRRCLVAALRWLDEPETGYAAGPAAVNGDNDWVVLTEVGDGEAQRADEEAAGAGRGSAGEPLARPPAAPAEPRPPLRPRRGAGGPVSQRGHAYAVWRLPGSAQDTRGVHAGGPRGWRAIASAIPGGRYRPGTDRLQRAESLSAALAVYEAEAERHGAPTPTRVFAW